MKRLACAVLAALTTVAAHGGDTGRTHDLSKYPRSIVGVSECKVDVAFNVSDPELRTRLRDQCYQLYPESIREQMREIDRNPPCIREHRH